MPDDFKLDITKFKTDTTTKAPVVEVPVKKKEVGILQAISKQTLEGVDEVGIFDPEGDTGLFLLGNILANVVDLSQDALSATATTDKKSEKLEDTFIERFAAGRNPSDVVDVGDDEKNHFGAMSGAGVIADMLNSRAVKEFSLDILGDPVNLLGLGFLSKTKQPVSAISKVFKAANKNKKGAQIAEAVTKRREIGKQVLDKISKGVAGEDVSKVSVKAQNARKPLWQMQPEELAIYKKSPVEVRPVIDTQKINSNKVSSMYARNKEALETKAKKTISAIRQSLASKIVDVSGTVKRKLLKLGGKEAVIKHDLAKGAHAKAVEITEKEIGGIYKGLDKSDIELLDQIINSRRVHVIDSYKQKSVRIGAKNFAEGFVGEIKHTENLTGFQHSDFLKSIPKERQEKLFPLAQKYFNTMRNQLQILEKEGLITKAEMDIMFTKDYSPRKFIQHIDPERSYNFSPRSVSDSGIKRLDTGSEQYLETNSRLLLSETISRVQARVFRNRANKSLYEFAENTPANGIAEVIDPLTDVGGGFDKISVMIDGERKALKMPVEFSKEWVASDPQISRAVANTLGWVSGSKPLKALATGYNPEFALANLPRDIAHAWLTTDEFSSFAPKAFSQIAKDFAETASDVIRRKGAYKAYINEGGGMEFLTHQGQASGKGKIKQYLGYIGETSEAWTRLAIRNRAIKNGKNAEEATWIARNYLDFSQGGSFAKAADAALPYLNAGIQGTRGIFRAAKTNPASFNFKVAQLATMATGLYMANKNNPEAYSQISDREKINNWIITTPFSYDDKGETKYFYAKIPKDQGQRALTTIFESLTAKSMGDDVNFSNIATSLKESFPIMPDNFLPPTLSAAIGYASNIDFWRNEKIWKGPKVEPSAERYNSTNSFFVNIGGATGISPVRLERSVSKIIPQSNMFTSLTGDGWRAMNLSEDDNKMATEELILKQPFVRRVLRSTNPFNAYGNLIEETRIKQNTGRHELNLVVDRLDIKEAFKFIRETDIDIEEKKRLLKRAKNNKKWGDIPEKRYWLNLADLSPESRAYVFYDRWSSSSGENKRDLEKTLVRLRLASDRFKIRFGQLRRKR